jgi:predicted acyltransferase (DUF342 family)
MKLISQRRTGVPSRRRGAAIVMVAVTLVGLFAVSLALWSNSLTTAKEQRASFQRLDTRYAAEAALAEAYVLHIAQPGSATSGAIGSSAAPLDFGGTEYWVERTNPGTGIVSLLATARDGRTASAVELVLRRDFDAFHVWGAFGDESLTMSSNARVDSYNSTLGAYALQATNGSGSSLYALTNGDVGSNGNVHMSQNSKVWGDVTPGEMSAATVLGNAVVTGSTAPAKAKFAMPPLEIPTYASLGALSVANSATVNIPSGNRQYTNLKVGKQSTLNITGPAKIVMNNFLLENGGAVIIDATAGPVEIYVHDDFVMRSNSQMRPTDYAPKNLKVFLKSDNIINPDLVVDLDDVEFQSNSKLYGTIYAPNAHVDINSNFELFGSLIARRVTLRSNSLIHFDEALMLGDEDQEIVYEVVAWLSRPARP